MKLCFNLPVLHGSGFCRRVFSKCIKERQPDPEPAGLRK